MLGQRALNAARAGIECKIAQQFPIADANHCLFPDSYIFANVYGLENCRYETSLSETTVTDGGNTFEYTKFTSTGYCTAGKVMVSRTVYADAMEAQ